MGRLLNSNISKHAGKKKRKSPQTLDGSSGLSNRIKKGMATGGNIGKSLPWRNRLSFPHVYFELKSRELCCINAGGKNAETLCLLLYGGATRWNLPHVRQRVHRLKKELGVRVRWRWESFEGKRHKRYFLKGKAKWVLEVHHACA